MAVKQSASLVFHIKSKKKRPGVISKCKTSSIKTSKHYKKAYRGQGRAWKIKFYTTQLDFEIWLGSIEIN